MNPYQQFNELTAEEHERLVLLNEECAEVQKAISKILRHGYESTNPTIQNGPTNRSTLEDEIGDVLFCIDFLTDRGDLKRRRISSRRLQKERNVKPYLHHQKSQIKDNIEFHVGDCVKFNHESGSIGQIMGIQESFNAFYIEWIYGRDIRGDIMTSRGSVKASQITKCSVEEYNERRDRKGFGDR